jgi:hypothetical protein
MLCFAWLSASAGTDSDSAWRIRVTWFQWHNEYNMVLDWSSAQDLGLLLDFEIWLDHWICQVYEFLSGTNCHNGTQVSARKWVFPLPGPARISNGLFNLAWTNNQSKRHAGGLALRWTAWDFSEIKVHIIKKWCACVYINICVWYDYMYVCVHVCVQVNTCVFKVFKVYHVKARRVYRSGARFTDGLALLSWERRKIQLRFPCCRSNLWNASMPWQQMTMTPW